MTCYQIPEMTLSAGFHIVVCLLLVAVKDTSGQMNASNAVAEIGGEAIFNCSDPSFAINWVMSKDGTSTNQLAIAAGCNVNAALQNHYRTEQTGGPPFICNLIVFDVAMEHAGVYWCTVSGDRFNALLTVLESAPVNTVNSTTSVVENEIVMSECSLSYNGSMPPAPTLRPYFYWTNFSGQNVSSYYDSMTETTAVSRLAVTAARENNITSYTCHVYLQLIPADTVGYANKTPSVDMSASSPTIEVLYSPLISNITSEGRNDSTSSCEISTVTCEATANPAASYTWIDLEEPSKIINNQSYGRAEFGRNYNCSATNTIRNIAYTDVKTHEERNEYSTRPPCKGCRMSTVNITGETCTNGRCSCLFDCNMTVTCTADAYPEPTYHWIRKQNSEVVRNNTGILDAVPDGIYTCVAKNRIDGYEFEARIDMEVVNCYAFTIMLIVLLVWLGCCTLAVLITTLVFGGFKHIMECCFPCLCAKPESSKNPSVLWVCLFFLTSCLASGIVMALVICLCFKDKAEPKSDTGSTASSKKSTKSLVLFASSVILFVIVVVLWIVAIVGMSPCF